MFLNADVISKVLIGPTTLNLNICLHLFPLLVSFSFVHFVCVFFFFWCYCRDVDYDEKRLSLIRRIDFAWAVEKDEEKKKKQKTSKEASTPWQWQSMVENLQLAHQELSVIIDLINTVSSACYILHGITAFVISSIFLELV